MSSVREFLVVALAVVMTAGSISCGPPQQNGGHGAPSSGSTATPELTKEVIDERINDARVYDVLPESGKGDPIPWGFDEDEPKEIVVVDQQVNGTRATVVLDIKTSSVPRRGRQQRQLAGQIRTDWELRTGWVLRRWEIINTENISMKYRDLPSASPEPEH